MTDLSDLNKTSSLGEILRNKREELKMEISQVSSHLRVKISDIEAIEENDLTKIATNIYVLGFIRSYAKFLRIDNKIIEEKISKIKDRSSSEGKKTYVLINLDEEDNLSPTKKLFLNALISASLLILIIFSLYNFSEGKSDLITNSDLVSQLESIFADVR
jgi:cytoskeletal protein RodZ